jgi:hypothetical protein
MEKGRTRRARARARRTRGAPEEEKEALVEGEEGRTAGSD